jgi:hypothetical protein
VFKAERTLKLWTGSVEPALRVAAWGGARIRLILRMSRPSSAGSIGYNDSRSACDDHIDAAP